MGIKSVTFVPDPPRSGKSVTVTVKGSPSEDVTEGKLHVDVRVLGITVDSQVLEICDLVKCPLAAGKDFTSEVTQEIPVGTPDGMGATVRMTLVQGKKTLTCLESKVEISGDKDKNVLSAMAPGEVVEKDAEFLFARWKAQFPKAVHNFRVFVQNLRKIVLHNKKDDQTFKMAMNEFGSMTEEEFVQARMGIREPRQDVIRNGPIKPRMTVLRSEVFMADPPAELDWTEKGMVSPVKNQGSCGSCWAFSAIGAMESAYAIKTGQLVEFSEQMLVSCDDTDYGCQGGWMDSAYDWVERTSGGLCTEGDYPYSSGVTSAKGECLMSKCQIVSGSAPKGYVDIPASEAAIQAAVATTGPVSVGIQADQAAFQFYHSGVLTGTCGTHLNHGVLIVGYGVDKESGTPFWKVKNSWGGGWGESGYVRIQRNKKWPLGGQCGIATHASYPVY
jgi:C1A family cysteine protease